MEKNKKTSYNKEFKWKREKEGWGRTRRSWGRGERMQFSLFFPNFAWAPARSEHLRPLSLS